MTNYQLARFNPWLEAWLPAYAGARVTYLAISSAGQQRLLHARVTLPGAGDEAGEIAADSRQHIGPLSFGRFAVRDRDMRGLIETALQGRLDAPASTLQLPDEPQTSALDYQLLRSQLVSSWYRPLEGHYPMLRITRGSRSFTINAAHSQEEIDRLLICACTPFDGIDDLLASLQLPGDAGRADTCTIEIAARAPVRFARDSHLAEGSANVRILAAMNVNLAQASLAIRQLDHESAVIDRSSRPFVSNELTLDARGAAFLELSLIYNGHVADRHVLAAPGEQLNEHFAVVNHFHTELASIQQRLGLNKKSGRLDSTDFEQAVAMLFGILGFHVMHVGVWNSECPDIVARASSSPPLLLECITDGLLNQKQKLEKLCLRAQRLQADLALHREPQSVQAVLVISREMKGITEELEMAGRLNIAVIDLSRLAVLLGRARLPARPAEIAKMVVGWIPSRMFAD